MLKLDRVSKFYSSNGIVTSGFSKVSLDFQLGEFVAITGESGSGKSTLLNVISGLDSYEEGEMYIFGQPTSGYSSEDMERYRKRYIGNIFQTFNLVNNYTVYQNVELVLLLAGYKKEEVRPRVDEIIDAVGMTKYRKTKASKLSGGQKQRVAIARALAKDTPIIVADEPTGNLDVESAKSIIQLLAQLSKNRLILIVTHNYEQVEPYISRQITMHDGKIVEDRRRPNAAVYQQSPVEPADMTAETMNSAETRSDALFEDETPGVTPVVQTPAPTTAQTAPQTATGATGASSDSLELSALDFLSQIGGTTAVSTTPEVSSKAPKEMAGAPESIFDEAPTTDIPAVTEAPSAPEPATETAKTKNTKKTETKSRPVAKTPPTDFHEARNGKLSKGNTVRLGIRNAFSLPAKLLLLLVVFLFLTTGTFSAYTSYKNNQRSSEEGHYSQVFQNADASRLVLMKKDKSAISQDDLAKLRQVENVKTVNDHDLTLDYTFTLSKYPPTPEGTTEDKKSEDFIDSGDNVTVSLMGTDAQTGKLTAGRKPENDQEAVLLYMPSDSGSQRMAESMLDQTYTINSDYSASSLGENMDVNVKIVGIAKMSKAQEEACLTSNTGWIQGILCTGETKLQEAQLACTAGSVYMEANANGNLIALGYSERSQYPFVALSTVPKGSILIPDMLAYNYPNGNAKGKPFSITATWKYESKSLNLTVSNVYNERNYKQLTGYTGKYVEMSQGVYMNPEDIQTLYQQNTYQVSVLVKDTMDMSKTESALRSMGYNVLNVQKSAGYQTRTISILSNAMNTIVLVILLLVLYFINYLIIKLIYKSRNTYFSTVRMLGGSHKDCSGLLLVDMLTVAHLAFILCIAGLLAIKNGLIEVTGTFATMARFVNVQNAAVLYFLVIVLSILLARRYSKQIFKKTAMNAYKEEV